MKTLLALATAVAVVAGVICVWAWLICLGRGLERRAARPAALCALVLFALAALSAGVALAQQPHHHEFHQDFYRHWKQPGTGVSCCDARVTRDGQEIGDCEPTRAEIRAGTWWAWLRQESRWIEIPDARIIREHSPNVTDAHLCWNYGRVLCFVPPATGG
ncbi:MAG: hypothetical protein ACK4JB_19335 [Reyranella sp.]